MKTASLIIDAGRECCTPICCTGTAGDTVMSLVPPVSWATIETRDGTEMLCMNAPVGTEGTNTQTTLRKESCFVNGVATGVDDVVLTIEIDQASTLTHDPDLSNGVPAGYVTEEYYGRDAVLNFYEEQRYTYLGDTGGNGSTTPLGHDPFVSQGEELCIFAVRSTTQQRSQIEQKTNSDYGDWLSGFLAQTGPGQHGGIFRHCVKADAVVGQFFGGWLNSYFTPIELDTFEYGIRNNQFTGSATLTELHQALHGYPTTLGEYSGDGMSAVHDMVCNDYDDRCVCHEVRFRPTDQFDARGCRIFDITYTTNCIITATAQTATLWPLRHVFSLAISDGRDWVDGPPTVDQIKATICDIESYQYNASADYPAIPAITRPVFTNANMTFDPPWATNWTLTPDSSTLVNPITQGNVPGWTFVERKVRIGGFDSGLVNPTQYVSNETGNSNLNQIVYAVEVWRDPATGVCIEIFSDGILFSG